MLNRLSNSHGYSLCLLAPDLIQVSQSVSDRLNRVCQQRLSCDTDYDRVNGGNVSDNGPRDELPVVRPGALVAAAQG